MEEQYYKEGNTIYVTRDVYEQYRKNNIEFDSIPKIIQGKNYYSIPEEVLNNPKETKEKKEDRIITYRDGLTSQIYLPEEYNIEMSSNKKTILNKKCYYTTIHQLEQILNKEIIIATVFLKEDKTNEITICKTDYNYFMQENDSISFGLNLDNRKRIKVDGTLYVEITREEINLIDIISKKEDRKTNIVLKEIVPKMR